MILIIILCLSLGIDIQSYMIKEIVPGDSAASLDLLFQGNVMIDYYNINDSTICIPPLEKVLNSGLPLHTKEITISNTPNNYLNSQAYRMDYYMNNVARNNPNTINTPYILDCIGGNPYKCHPKTSSLIHCIFGLRISTYGSISLQNQLHIDYSFSLQYSLIMNSKDEIITLFHDSPITDVYNDFIANGNSLTFLRNAFFIKVSIENDSKLIMTISTISNTGVITQEMNIQNMFDFSSLKELDFILEYNQRNIENCLSLNNIQITKIGSYSTFFLKISINNSIKACLSVNLNSLINNVNKVNVSFIGQSPKDLLLFNSLSTDSSNYHCSIPNKAIMCGYNPLGLSTKTINVKNISKYNKDSIGFLYSYHNNYRMYCGTSDGIILIDSSYELGLNTCPYTVSYNPSQIQGIYIKNNLITLALMKFYPIQMLEYFTPSTLYDLCVNSSDLLLEIGYCSCELCIKTIELSATYHHSQKCYEKYNHRCNCFDQSSITPSTPYNFISLSFNLCTECYIDDNCSLNNKLGKCHNDLQTSNTLILHIDSTITSISSQYIGKVILYGHCLCGALTKYTSLINNCLTYDVYYDVDSPIVLKEDMLSCIQCLYDSTQTILQCQRMCFLFEIKDIGAYHVPNGGYHCTSCVYASEFMQTIQLKDEQNYLAIKQCIDDHPEDFYSECMTVIKEKKYPSNQVFSGLLTHFRVECPGRDYATYGSVCIPWYGFNAISFYTLVYKKTINSVQWDDDFQCINDQCEQSTKLGCVGNTVQCVCHDSCPLGKGKYFNYNLISCSGNGVCTNQSKCYCDPGFIEPTCEIHCSETKGGCCVNNTDCLHNDILKTCKVPMFSLSKIGYCDS